MILTDEEIMDLSTWATIEDLIEDVAQAQLKKLIDEARLKGVLNPDGSMCSDASNHYSFWQSLLDEVK